MVQLLGTVSHHTFIRSAPIINFHKHAQDTRSYFTECFAEYEQRTLYGALVVTLVMLLRLINRRFIITPIIIINVKNWVRDFKNVDYFCPQLEVT